MSATTSRPKWHATPRRRHPKVAVAAPGPADGVPAHSSTGFVGSPGDSVKLTAYVETIIKSGNGMRTYLLRDVVSENVLEWCSARRYSIAVGETLKLSGTVAAHERRGGQCITRLRNCFNPMRVP